MPEPSLYLFREEGQRTNKLLKLCWYFPLVVCKLSVFGHLCFYWNLWSKENRGENIFLGESSLCATVVTERAGEERGGGRAMKAALTNCAAWSSCSHVQICVSFNPTNNAMLSKTNRKFSQSKCNKSLTPTFFSFIVSARHVVPSCPL